MPKLTERHPPVWEEGDLEGMSEPDTPLSPVEVFLVWIGFGVLSVAASYEIVDAVRAWIAG
jgi:hypothetical protein